MNVKGFVGCCIGRALHKFLDAYVYYGPFSNVRDSKTIEYRVKRIGNIMLPYFIILLYDHILVSCFVAGRIRVWVKGHVYRYRVTRYKAGQRTYLCEQSNFVNL